MANPLLNIGYGLYVITAREMQKDNGCIINSIMQITDVPQTIAVSLNKKNYTHNMIKNTGIFNISILSNKLTFDVVKHFGFQSGKDINKFENCKTETRSKNGLIYLPKYTNTYISGKVINTIDCGTHTMFIAEITDSKILNEDKSISYLEYLDDVKPKSETVNTEIKKGKTIWRCVICGYEYEGEELPDDYECPICGHGKEDFEKIII